jgi:cell fate regulator YaaT (PSP1 superfamily)
MSEDTPAPDNGAPDENHSNDAADEKSHDRGDSSDGKQADAKNQSNGNDEKGRNSGNRGDGGRNQRSRKSSGREPDGPTAVCRYGQMRYTGEFRYGKLKEPLKPGSKVVIRTDRGVELGQVVTPVCRNEESCGPCAIHGEQLQDFLENQGGDYPFRRNGRLLRIASQQDLIEHRHLVDSAHHAATFCRNTIRELKLPMRLVTVEHLLGGERIVFYFTAEERVDFRELVRRLAGQYRTRIEMRQVGARDEARLVGDYERCGQRCCCQQFLKDLKPVSMRMAKVQKATLDPSKISGRCGRLMCCLRYEDKSYNELRKKLPHRNTWIRTEETMGRVIDTQIITQLVKIMQPDGNIAAVGVDEIVERDMKPPTDDEQRAHARESRRANRQDQIDQAVEKVDGAEAPSDQGDKKEQDSGKGSDGKKPKRRGRRRRGRRRSKGKKGGGSGDGGQQRSGGPKSKGRGRRRRKPKGKSGGGS